MSRSIGGFTLIELTVALVVSGVAMLLALGIFSAASDGTRLLQGGRHALDQRMNAERWLRIAFLDLDLGAGDGGFDGKPESVEFSTWLPGVHGWDTRERVALRFRNGQLLAQTSDGIAIVLADSITGVGFDYLLEPGADSRWVHSWVSPVSAPLVVRLRLESAAGGRIVADTTLYLIKARG